MPKFTCICIDSQGQRVKTRYEADSIPEATSFLRDRNLIPVSVKEIKSDTFVRQTMRELGGLLAARQIKASEKAVFFRQLATMLKAGMNLLDCLKDLSSHTDNKNFSLLIEEVRRYVAWGRSFSEALSEYPHIFPSLITEMIAVGEEAGSLDEVVSDMAKFLESQIDLKKKVASASRYPMFILAFFVVVVGVMVFYLIPTFKGIFSSFGAELPPLTRFTIAVSDFLIKNSPYVIVLILAMGFVGYGYSRSGKGQGILDKMKFRIPVMGKLTYNLVLARVCRTLGILLRSGVPLIVALEHTAAVSDNVVAAKAIREMREKIVQGSTLAQEVKKQSFFPSLVAGMIHTGEESGKLSDILPQVADFYDAEVDYQVKALTSTLEPVLIIGLGAIAAFFVLAMYLPIFQLGEVMG
ncbi:hypothetical protein CEE34_04825 [Candidatus Aerophobetes bacterium Ae_b3a]|nr:MAG: hypothetical protein CEE34_04825 [Candidatus Aerophobetes bacterium Ae_b3a]